MYKFLLIHMNLQLLAEVNTTASPGLSDENKIFYDKVLLQEAAANLVHDQFGQERPIPKNGGKTIEFRKFSALPKATKPLTEGVTPEGQSLSVSTITATVQQYGDYVLLSDMLDLTAIDPVVVEATKLIGKQAGLTMDTVVRNEIQSGLNVSYCPKIGPDGAETEVLSRADLNETCQVTVDVVQQVVAKLRAQNAPTIKGDYVSIIHPFAAYDLMRDPDWKNPHQYQDTQNIYTGEIGKIGGVRFVESSEAKIYSGAGCPEGLAVFGTLFFGEGAYGKTSIGGGGVETIIKQKGSAGTADPLDQRSSVGWKGIKTAKILNPNYLIRVESCSKRFSKTAKEN